MHILAQHLQLLDIRAANDHDQPFLQQLYASTRADLLQFPGDPAMIAGMIAMQQNMQAIAYRNSYPEALHSILEHAGTAVGRLMVDVGPKEIRLIDIAFLPQARGQGFGKAVLRALQEGAHEKDLPITLSVNTGNPQARRLYLSLGFEVYQGDEMADRMVWHGHQNVI